MDEILYTVITVSSNTSRFAPTGTECVDACSTASTRENRRTRQLSITRSSIRDSYGGSANAISSSRGINEQTARASVYTDGTYSGEIDILKTIPTEVVIDARYLPPVEARNRFGSDCHCAGGVILVRTRGDGD